MWRGVGALCLSSLQQDSIGIRGARRITRPNEDKHKAPASTSPRPLSLQETGDDRFAFLPALVVKIHQAIAMAYTSMLEKSSFAYCS